MKNIDKKMAEAAKSILGGRPMFEHQRLACAALLAGRNVLLVSPTGSGKSLCYQLPTLLSGKPTLVVSPLIALMDDQEEKTRSLGLSVGRLHSGVDLAKQWWTVGSWINGTLRILYTSPERLCDDRLRRSLGQRPPGLIVIDEAHCISTWGHRFRPAYRRLGETLNAFAKAPTLAMTASARPAVRQDILQTLKLDDPLSIIVPFSFPRLRLSTVETYRPEERLVFIAALASSPGRLPMVVCCLTKKQCQSTAYFLAQSGHSVTTYHAEMTVQDRADVATTFRGATRAVLVATSAPLKTAVEPEPARQRRPAGQVLRLLQSRGASGVLRRAGAARAGRRGPSAQGCESRRWRCCRGRGSGERGCSSPCRRR